MTVTICVLFFGDIIPFWSLFFNQNSVDSKFFLSEQASEGLDLSVLDLTKTIPVDFNTTSKRLAV